MVPSVLIIQIIYIVNLSNNLSDHYKNSAAALDNIKNQM